MKSAGFNYFFYVWAFLIKDLEAAFFTLNIINRMDVKAYWLFTSSAFIHTRSILIYNLISNKFKVPNIPIMDKAERTEKINPVVLDPSIYDFARTGFTYKISLGIK